MFVYFWSNKCSSESIIIKKILLTKYLNGSVFSFFLSEPTYYSVLIHVTISTAFNL